MLTQFLQAAGNPISPTGIGKHCRLFTLQYKSKRILQKASTRDRKNFNNFKSEKDREYFERSTKLNFISYTTALESLQLVNTKIISTGSAQKPLCRAALGRKLTSEEKRMDELAKEAMRIIKSSFSTYEAQDPVEIEIYRLLAERGAMCRKADMVQRVSLEVAHAVRNNHTIIFDTITVENKHYTYVFKDEPTKVFKEYVRRFKKQTHPDAVYFGVVEAGSKHGRLHVHILWFIPSTAHELRWQDPSHNPKRKRHIKEINSGYTWPYGMVRNTNLIRWAGDLWSQSHKWPVKEETGDPIPGNPGGIVGYVVKYLTKDVVGELPSWSKRWRIRKTQSLGIRLIHQQMSEKTLPELVAMLKQPAVPENRKFRMMAANLAKTKLQRRLANTGPSIQAVERLPSRNVFKELYTLMTAETKKASDGSEIPSIGNSIPVVCDLAGAFDPETGAQITEKEWQEAIASSFKWVCDLQKSVDAILDKTALPGVTAKHDASWNPGRKRT